MNGLNKMMVIGNLGYDSELKELSGGNALLKFKVAVTDQWMTKEGQKAEKTTWFRCII